MKSIRGKRRKPIETIVNSFVRNLQWDLRGSYNSSSCLNKKQTDFLKENLYDLLLAERSK